MTKDRDDAKLKSRIRQKHLGRIRVFVNNHGTAFVRINSANAYKSLSRIADICSVKVRMQSDDYLIISFQSKHLSQVIAILNKLCYNYQIIKIIGVLPSILTLSMRFGVIIGTALVILATIFSMAFVTRVSVSGCENAATELQVSELLVSRGIKKGCRISSVDCSSLEKSILAIDGIAFASVTMQGGHIVVIIKEELPHEEFEEITGSVVTATKMAVVTRVLVNGGTAVVGYGDVVDVGDVLIDGYTLYGEDRIPVRASGEVFGKVYYQKKLYFGNTTIDETIGKTKTVTKLSAFGIVPKTPRCEFEDYTLSVTVSKNDFLLPFTIYRFTFTELKRVETEVEHSDDELKRIAYSSLLAEIESAVKILNVYYLVDNVENGKYVTVTIDAEERIT